MKRIFYNNNKELRNIWKIIFIFVFFNMISLTSAVAAGVIYQNVNIKSFPEMISETMNHDLGYDLAILIMCGLIYLFYRYILKKEKRSWIDLGLSRDHRFLKILQGFAFGAIFVAVYISILILMKQVEFEMRPLTSSAAYSLLNGLLIFSGVAFAEEITFRGYFQYLLGKKNKYAGMVLSAVIFALYHLVNADNYTIASLIYLTLGGILLGIIRLSANNIWFPIGFHIAWNWMEIRVFGLNNISDHHWLSTKIVHNTIWNGGEGGSGLVLILLQVAFIFGFGYFYSRKRDETKLLFTRSQ